MSSAASGSLWLSTPTEGIARMFATVRQCERRWSGAVTCAARRSMPVSKNSVHAHSSAGHSHSESREACVPGATSNCLSSTAGRESTARVIVPTRQRWLRNTAGHLVRLRAPLFQLGAGTGRSRLVVRGCLNTVTSWSKCSGALLNHTSASTTRTGGAMTIAQRTSNSGTSSRRTRPASVHPTITVRGVAASPNRIFAL